MTWTEKAEARKAEIDKEIADLKAENEQIKNDLDTSYREGVNSI